MNELNALYSINPEVAAFGGWNRIHMSDFPDRVFGSSDHTNNVAQLGLIARHRLTDGLDVYAKGALGPPCGKQASTSLSMKTLT